MRRSRDKPAPSRVLRATRDVAAIKSALPLVPDRSMRTSRTTAGIEAAP